MKSVPIVPASPREGRCVVSMKCPECESTVPDANRACPTCGVILDDSLHPDSSPRAKVLTIEFGVSSSVNYKRAVDLAKEHESYSESGTGKELRHAVSIPVERFESVRPVFDLVRNWKSTAFMVDGHSVTPSDILPSLDCFGERCRAYSADGYCRGRDDASDYNDNDFGCRHTGVNVYGWDGLTAFGSMSAGGVFRLDRNRMRHKVTQNLERVRYCPALRLDDIQMAIDRTPDTIDPRRNPDWEYVSRFEGGKSIAVGVRRKSLRSRSGYVIHDYSASAAKIVIEAPPPPSKISSVKSSNRVTRNSAQQARGGCLMPVLASLALLVLAVVAH